MESEKQFIKKELPIGTGRESEPKEILPAIEVDNEVIWVNPDFDEMPFNLKEGEPTKLGMFLTPKPKEGEKTVDLKVSEKHGRSALLGRIIFQDTQGNFYRDLDIKGMGLIENKKAFSGKNVAMRVGRVKKKFPDEESFGTFGLSDAKNTNKMIEKFLEAGIRTERYIAIVKLNEVINRNGKKISIEEARKREMIYPNEESVIVLRALGTKFRICDVRESFEGCIRLDDARHLVAQELGVKEEDFSQNDYLKWFAKTAGENLGLMQKNRWCHNYLNSHNITLDCRIIDPDCAFELGPESNEEDKLNNSKMRNDYYTLRKSLSNFFTDTVKDSNMRNDLLDDFSKTFQKTLGYTPKFLIFSQKEK